MQPTAVWPELVYSKWQETCTTLQLWTQIAGKVRLALTPWLNHSWQVALYVSSRGLTTSPIPYGPRSFEMEFNFLSHALVIEVSDGSSRRIALQPQAVADFHKAVLRALHELGISVDINEYPCEIPGAIRFDEDHIHASYDREAATRFWRALVQIDRVFKKFRTGFLGKASPVHFFWGSFDLAVTRFSGRPAPLFSGTAPGVHAKVMQEAYSHEVSSAGFWPGGNGVEASFYSYAYPTPPQFKDQPVSPNAASFNTTLGEFLLPYQAVREAADPAATLLAFLQSTYEAAARTAAWNRAALECPLGASATPRSI